MIEDLSSAWKHPNGSWTSMSRSKKARKTVKREQVRKFREKEILVGANMLHKSHLHHLTRSRTPTFANSPQALQKFLWSEASLGFILTLLKLHAVFLVKLKRSVDSASAITHTIAKFACTTTANAKEKFRSTINYDDDLFIDHLLIVKNIIILWLSRTVFTIMNNFCYFLEFNSCSNSFMKAIYVYLALCVKIIIER